MDGTSDARQRSAALAGLHNETGADMHELGVKKGELEQAVAALKQNGDQSCAENSCLCRGVLRLCFAANFRLCTSLSKFEGTEKLVRDRFCSRLA